MNHEIGFLIFGANWAKIKGFALLADHPVAKNWLIRLPINKKFDASRLYPPPQKKKKNYPPHYIAIFML